MIEKYKELNKFYINRFNLIKDNLNIKEIDETNVIDPNLEIKNDKIIMIIGEAPGGTEVELKEPFCGPAGKNLSYLIEQADLDRKKDFLITNAFPFRTFQYSEKGKKNRTPSSIELKEGSKLLVEELKILKPNIILLLGGSAKKSIKYIPEIKKYIKNMERNSFKEINLYDFKTILTLAYHPSPLVYNTKSKAEDLQKYFISLKKIFN